ncbi:MAG: leucine-rich repeat domain-containing protein [Candidatus Methanomethylophilus sp.]|nr:leucine-rich repeat domain-containing protein [Methanomethylophilus sp.]
MSVRWTLMAVSAVLAVACVFMICDADGSDADPASNQCGKDLYWSMSEGCATFSGSGNMWDYTLSMERGWKDCTSVILPVGLTHIGNNAFYMCTSLESVTIGNSVTSIGDYAFRDCIMLKSVTIPDSVTSIREAAFYNCSSLESVTIGNSVTSIREAAFYGCSSLESVTIPDSITSIGENAFDDCSSLESVTIGNSVTSIGNEAFAECTSLVSIVVDEGNENYSSEDGVLFNKNKTMLVQCPGGKEGGYSIPASVTSIGESAFLGCSSLASVTIPDSVTSIGNYAFHSCNNLAEVNVVCSNPLNITQGDTSNGYVAYYASNVNLCHTYSATYGWSDDGKSCTVHIICANTANHNHDEPAAVTSKVKIPPTETEMGTTEYSVSGTYDGFAYSDTKDVQDIPATGGDPYDPGDKTSSYNRFPALALTLSVLSCLGMVGAVVLLGRRTV